MSDQKVDLSLDDIIKMNKKNPANQRKGGNKQTKPNLQRLKNLGTRSGIIRKGGPKQINRQQAPQKKELTMLHVSNLDFGVSNDDVRELFSEVGQIKKAVVHYDKTGRSLGTAEVTFTARDSAIRAIKKYNNVPLDGRPMSITLVPGKTNVRSPAKARIGIKPGSGIYKRPQTKGTRGGPVTKGRQVNTRGGKPNFQRGNRREQKKPVTAEQLDADLEAYTMNVD